MGVFTGVERLGNDGGGMLGLWVDLGDEMEENWMLERAWFQGEKEREVLLKIRGRRRRSLLGNSLWTSALSLG